MEGLLRLLAAIVIILTPSVLFVGFWRLLMAMRDDDLVNRVLAHERVGQPSNPRMAEILGIEHVVANSRALAPNTVRCRSCGGDNPDHATYCGACLSKL